MCSDPTRLPTSLPMPFARWSASDQVGRDRRCEARTAWRRPELRSRLRPAGVVERGCSRPDHLPDGFARDLQVADDLLDRFLLNEISAADPRNRLHDQHPRYSPLMISKGSVAWGPDWTPYQIKGNISTSDERMYHFPGARD